MSNEIQLLIEVRQTECCPLSGEKSIVTNYYDKLEKASEVYWDIRNGMKNNPYQSVSINIIHTPHKKTNP